MIEFVKFDYEQICVVGMCLLGCFSGRYEYKYMKNVKFESVMACYFVCAAYVEIYNTDLNTQLEILVRFEMIIY